MDLWLQITLCVLGVLFLWLLIYTVSVAGLKTGLTLLRKGELIGFENAKKLEEELLRQLEEGITEYSKETYSSLFYTGVKCGLEHSKTVLEAVIQGNQKQIDTIKEELDGK